MQTNGFGWQVQWRVTLVSSCISLGSDGPSRFRRETVSFHFYSDPPQAPIKHTVSRLGLRHCDQDKLSQLFCIFSYLVLTVCCTDIGAQALLSTIFEGHLNNKLVSACIQATVLHWLNNCIDYIIIVNMKTEEIKAKIQLFTLISTNKSICFFNGP